MKEILKNSLALFGRTVVIDIMCLFLVISLLVLITAAFSENIGYEAIGTSSETQESEVLYKHYYADGEDTKKAEYEENGYTVTERKIRSEISKAGNAVYLTVTAVFCLILTVSFVYPKFWQMGTKDSNLVQFKHKTEDKLKGLKCGILAILPGIILLCVFYFVLRNTPIGIYKIFNFSVYSLIDLVIGSDIYFKEVSFLQFLGLLALKSIVPLTAYGAYLLGYKNISLGEKFIYKKKKEV